MSRSRSGSETKRAGLNIPDRGIRAICLAALGVLAILGAPDTTARAEKMAFNVDTLLALKDIGTVAIDPAGRRAVWVEVPALSERQDFGVELFAGGPRGGVVKAAVLAGAAPPTSIAANLSGTKWFGDFSPDSRKLVIFSAFEGHVRVHVYDFVSGDLIDLPGTPAWHSRYNFAPTWLGSGALLYQTLPDGEEPFLVVGRRAIAAQLNRAWTAAWNGTGPSNAPIVESYPDNRPVPRRGALRIYDLTSGRGRVLAEGLYADARVSPDGRRIAVNQLYRPAQPDPAGPDSAWGLPRALPTILDLESGRQVQAKGYDTSIGSLEWSPHGDLLLAFAWRVDQSDKDGVPALISHDGQVIPLRLDGLTLLSERRRGFLPRPERFGWAGSAPVVAAVSRQADGQNLEYPLARAPLPSDQRIDWYRLSASATPVNLTRGLEHVGQQAVAMRDGHTFIVADGGLYAIGPKGAPTRVGPRDVHWAALPADLQRYEFPDDILSQPSAGHRLTVMDLNTGKRRSVEVADGSRPLASSSAGSVILSRREDADGVALMAHRSGAAMRELAHVNGFLKNVERPSWVETSYTVDSVRLTSCTLLPVGYQPGKRYPVVVNIYPGIPSGCAQAKSSAPSAGETYISPALLASTGAVVVNPATPLDLLRGLRSPLEGLQRLAGAVVDALIRDGVAEPSHVSLIGVSQGGVSALWLAARDRRYCAVVAVNSWSDMASHYLSATALQLFNAEEYPFAGQHLRYDAYESEPFAMGVTPFDALDAYTKISPAFLARDIHAPVLLITSDMDSFPIAQFDEMYSALYRLRKRAAYVRYLGEGHGPASAPNVRDYVTRVNSWLQCDQPTP